MFRTIRQMRYDRLIKEGFLPFEAFAFSKFKYKFINDLRTERKRTVRQIAKYRGGKVYKQDIRNHVIQTYTSRYGKLDPIAELMDRYGGASGFAARLSETNSWTRLTRKIVEDESPNRGRSSGPHHKKGSQRKYRSRLDKGNVFEQRKRRKERERNKKLGKPNG